MIPKMMVALMCAWILWSQSYSKVTGNMFWILLDGYETKAACEGVKEIADSRVKKGLKFHVCLPDTFDPRTN